MQGKNQGSNLGSNLGSNQGLNSAFTQGALESIAAWLQLDYTPTLTLEATRAWLGVLGSAQAVVQASAHTLATLSNEAAATALKAPTPEQAAKRQGFIDAALAWLAAPGYAGTRHILTWDHPAYPVHLLTIADPPLVLFVQGNPAALNQPAVGIVGARNATTQGIANARMFAQALAEQDVTVVSGMALGIDAAAHEGALNAVNKPFATVAVVGTGIDRVYPAAHRELAHRIAAQGAVVSEFAIGTPPLPHHFPRRNRLISGLSRGVLVVEAALRSGSLITARVAGEQGREVLAIPGSIHAPLSKGCHQLIKQGAKLVESAQDVVEELRLTTFDSGAAPAKKTKRTPAVIETDAVLAAMGFEPMDVDTLAAATGLPASELLPRLTELELLGQLEAIDGGRFQRIVR